MGKIIAANQRTVTYTDDDFKTALRRVPGSEYEQADACATVVAAARNAHVVCGPGLAAVTAIMAGVPDAIATKWARQHLRRAA